MTFISLASLTFILYTYLGYPLLLWLLAKMAAREVASAPIFPRVTVLIAAMNEEHLIAARLENILAQDYPPDRCEIIVVSDGSTDRTDEIVRSFEDRRVTLHRVETRQGKAAALNRGIVHARGDIIIFTDVRQTFAPAALAQLAADFADPGVGCVSGELEFLKDPESSIRTEMGAYWRYEKWIRNMESRSGSVVGATGSIYAIRRDQYLPLPRGTLLDDVLTPLHIVMQGYRCIFNGRAIAYDLPSRTHEKEWRRKVRTLAGNWQLLSIAPWLLLPWRNPLWWRFISHKIFRLLVPFCLPLCLAGAMLADSPLLKGFGFFQLTLYLAAAAGAVSPAARKVRLVNTAYFFAVMNLAAIAGFWRWLTGKCESVWVQQ